MVPSYKESAGAESLWISTHFEQTIVRGGKLIKLTCILDSVTHFQKPKHTRAGNISLFLEIEMVDSAGCLS